MRSAFPQPASLILACAVLALAATAQAADTGTASTEEHDAAYARSLAEGRYLDGDLESAVQLYLEASRLSVNPTERAAALVNAAWLEFLLGDRDQAVAILQGALRADPELELDERLYTDEFVGVFLRARVRIVREGLQGASAARFAPPPPAPNEPAGIYARALGEFNQRNYDGALALFQRVASLTLGQEGDGRELRRSSLMRIGWLYYERGQFGDAANAYDEALGLDRADTAAWKNLGLARLRQRDLPAAVAAFREAYARDPGDLAIAQNLARALVQDESWEDAISWISDALRHHDRDAELQLLLGSAHAGRGSRQQAIEAWRSALGLDDSAEWSHGHRAAQQLAMALFEEGSYTESAAISQRALEHDPTDAPFWNLLGLAQQEGGDPAAATASFQRACDSDDKRAEYRNNLGRALAAAGDLGRAEEAFVRALSLEPGFETAQANLEQVRARLRQR